MTQTRASRLLAICEYRRRIEVLRAAVQDIGRKEVAQGIESKGTAQGIESKGTARRMLVGATYLVDFGCVQCVFAGKLFLLFSTKYSEFSVL